jgi:ketosteroid isomerase-like protein
MNLKNEEERMMFKHPNSLLLHQCLQAANAGDRQTLRALWADDIVWHVKGASPWQGEIKGAEKIFDYLADLGEVGTVGFHTEFGDVMVSNRRASVICHSRAEMGERQLDSSFLLIAKVVDRRIQEIITVPIDPERVSEFWQDKVAPAPAVG